MTTSSNAPTDDVRAEAIEAAAWAVAWLNELDGRAAAEDAVDAATPVLLAPIRVLATHLRHSPHEPYAACGRQLHDLLDRIEGARDE